MLEQAFSEVYTKFKLNLYRRIFNRFEEREATLTAVETFCVEVIYALGRPTINQFAHFVQISQANAAYKVACLIRKGYLTKERSTQDKREYHLAVTDKYLEYNGISYDYVRLVVDRARKRFPPADVRKLEEMLTVIARELMPEIPLPGDANFSSK
ncbi:MAG: winged helix-turn-helix transcriptional regulator [Angelakisella sp.]|jgi:DNA-binding MarR family transcriptional regulator|nr:winged helix-turn-helix transcriptional regulator [Angelakisella sp.]